MTNTQGGVRLRAWLREQRRTQKWLAEQIGPDAHQTYVSRWILGKAPPLKMAIAVEKITGIAPSEWLVPAGTPSDVHDDESLHARAG